MRRRVEDADDAYDQNCACRYESATSARTGVYEPRKELVYDDALSRSDAGGAIDAEYARRLLLPRYDACANERVRRWRR